MCSTVGAGPYKNVLLLQGKGITPLAQVVEPPTPMGLEVLGEVTSLTRNNPLSSVLLFSMGGAA